MVKYKIVTKDGEIYDMLTYLTHYQEINIPKGIDTRILIKILKPTRDKIRIVEGERGLKLKRDSEFNYNVYLKRILI